MLNYTKKFRLDDLTAFVVGGSGLIGKEICNAIVSAGGRTIILDKIKYQINKSKNEDSSLIWRMFDCSKLENLETQFIKQVKEFGIPDVFINCSYPRTKDWSNNSFKNITLNSFKENINIHMNSYAWLARLAA